MLQLHQRFMRFSTTNFLKIFRGIILKKYRYFSGKIPQEISGNFRTPNPNDDTLAQCLGPAL